MKNFFSMILNFANAIAWGVVLGTRIYENAALDFLTVVCIIFTALNLIMGIVSLMRYRKARAAEKQEKAEKKEQKEKAAK